MRSHFWRAATAALALGAAAIVAGCDSRNSDGSGPDAINPTLAVAVNAANDSVDVNSPMQLTISGHDDLSLKRVWVDVNGTTLFDTTFTSATPKFEQTVSVPMAGILSGSRLRIQAHAVDGAGLAAEVASASVTAFDPKAPVVSLASPRNDDWFRAGATMRAVVEASDESGLAMVGYEIYKVDPVTTVDVVVQSGQVAITGGRTQIQQYFDIVLNPNLPPGTYIVRGLAADIANNKSYSGSTAAISIVDPIKPGLDFKSPPADSNVTLGSNILTTLRLTDNVGVKRLSVVGITTSGDPDLGAVDTVVRYDSVFAPVNAGGAAKAFRAGLLDTTVKRLLLPKDLTSTVTGPLYLIARVEDVAGNDSTVVRKVNLVSGPALTVVRPGANAVAAPGKSLIVEIRGADRDGVRTLGYTVAGAFTLTRSAAAPTSKSDSLLFVDTLTVPANVTSGNFTITPFGTDLLGQPGSGSSVIVVVQSLATDNQGPLVSHVLSARVEADDSVSVRATDPSGIAKLGVILSREADGSVIRTDTVTSTGAFTDITSTLPLNVPSTDVGKKIVVRSFAIDARGNVGYSLPAGATLPQPAASAARADTALVVYGRTFSLPNGGLAADIAVDDRRARVFVSNLTFDRLDVWEQGTNRFASRKIAVGSDPWGMFVDNSGDTLLVANSGGTNISRVFLGNSGGTMSEVGEVANRRIKTPNANIFDVLATITNGVWTYDVRTYDYSDRPQYVAQSINGDIYFSTKPTPMAPDGTLRRYESYAPVPDVEQIWQYGTGAATARVSIINADSVKVVGGTTVNAPELVVCDHTHNMGGTSWCVRGYDPSILVDSLRTVYGADAVAVHNLDIKTVGLRDTTFVAASGNREWIGFGEAHTDSAGRVMLVQNPGNFLSPSLNVRDLINNASEHVFGLALNKDGSLAAVHGQESYVFTSESSFHLRLQGKINTYDVGAGIAFHPDNVDGASGPTSVAFVASSNGTIEIMDTFHFTARGVLPVRANLYGPLRVTKPWPGDDPQVVLKLFGLTTEGLIVIDIRASDIQDLTTSALRFRR